MPGRSFFFVSPCLGPHPAECIPNRPENSPTQMFMGWRMLTHGWALLYGSVLFGSVCCVFSMLDSLARSRYPRYCVTWSKQIEGSIMCLNGEEQIVLKENPKKTILMNSRLRNIKKAKRQEEEAIKSGRCGQH